MSSLFFKPKLVKENQLIYRFENNYGASVLRRRFSPPGYWELVLIRFESEDDNDFTILTDDTFDRLTPRDLERLLKKISKISPRSL